MKTLYKKNAGGSLSEWSISGNLQTCMITINYGIHGGSMQTQTVYVRINKSGRTLKEQMLLEMRSRISTQRDKGYRDTIEEALVSSDLNKLNLHKPMLAQRYDKLGHINMIDYFRQYKYDGHRMLVTKHYGKMIAYSRNGKVINTLDHILGSIDLSEGMTLDGEVYCHGELLQTITSWCKRKQDDTLKLRYVVYDLVNTTSLSYRLRHDILSGLYLGPCAEMATTWRSKEPIVSDLQKAIDNGYEGLILRNPSGKYGVGKRSRDLIKVKAALDDEFEVVDVVMSADGWGVLVCKTSNGGLFKVSAPGTIPQKHEIYENSDNYIGKMVSVQYFSETSDGIPFHPVAIRFRDKNSE